MSDSLFAVYRNTKSPRYRLVIKEGAPTPPEAVPSDWTFAAALTSDEVGEYGLASIEKAGYWLYRMAVRADPERCDSFARVCRQPPEHQSDHGEADESDAGACVAFEVAGHAAIATDPRQCSLNDPSLGNNCELVQLVSLHNLDDPFARAGGSICNTPSTITCICEDALDEREHCAGAFGQNAGCAVPVLDGGRMDRRVQQKAKGIDEDMSLAPSNLLACVIARGVEQSPPFDAPLVLWESMIAAEGLASLPSCSRTATYSA